MKYNSEQKEIISILRAAVKFLKKKGWCKYKLENKKGNHCISGAIGECKGFTTTSMEEKLGDIILDTINKTISLRRRYISIIDWNDKPRRRVKNVLDVLDRSIKSVQTNKYKDL